MMEKIWAKNEVINSFRRFCAYYGIVGGYDCLTNTLVVLSADPESIERKARSYGLHLAVTLAGDYMYQDFYNEDGDSDSIEIDVSYLRPWEIKDGVLMQERWSEPTPPAPLVYEME